jgi:hypothetical protein
LEEGDDKVVKENLEGEGPHNKIVDDSIKMIIDE